MTTKREQDQAGQEAREDDPAELMDRVQQAARHAWSWPALFAGNKLAREVFASTGVVSCVVAGFAVAGFLALQALSYGLPVNPWDLASAQDIVWMGARMPAFGVIASIVIWIVLGFSGATHGAVSRIDVLLRAWIERPRAAVGWRALPLRAVVALFPVSSYVVVAVLVLRTFLIPIGHIAAQQMAQQLKGRTVGVRLAGDSAWQSLTVRGRLGDFYVVVEGDEVRLLSSSRVVEFRRAD